MMQAVRATYDGEKIVLDENVNLTEGQEVIVTILGNITPLHSNDDSIDAYLAKLRKERNLKELYCYDRSLGHYWELRRKLTNREWIDINKRMREGKKLGEILQELKVLK